MRAGSQRHYHLPYANDLSLRRNSITRSNTGRASSSVEAIRNASHVGCVVILQSFQEDHSHRPVSDGCCDQMRFVLLADGCRWSLGDRCWRVTVATLMIHRSCCKIIFVRAPREKCNFIFVPSRSTAFTQPRYTRKLIRCK